MPAGAVHPNTGNFSRAPRLNIVERVRKLVSHKAYEKRPEWLEFVERAPPMELHNLNLRNVRIKSPYPAMVKFVLERFPDMRFQDCFVDGNDWSKGNDRYRDDHPVMQFVARQLQLMNEGSMTRQEAFEQTKSEYLERRRKLQDQRKMELALACNQRIIPAFNEGLYTTAAAVTRTREAELEVAHLNHIRRKLRMLRKEIEPHDRRRMSAKEVALDMEVERTGLLPRISPSKYKQEEVDTSSSADLIVESDEGPQVSHPVEFEQFDDKEADEFVWRGPSGSKIVEPSILSEDLRGGRPTSRPIDLVEEEPSSSDSQKGWSGFGPPASRNIERPEAPTHIAKTAVRPALTNARPDKQTIQSILARKKKEEIQRRIGKEPGEVNGEDLDFEDFMNMIHSSKK